MGPSSTVEKSQHSVTDAQELLKRDFGTHVIAPVDSRVVRAADPRTGTGAWSCARGSGHAVEVVDPIPNRTGPRETPFADSNIAKRVIKWEWGAFSDGRSILHRVGEVEIGRPRRIDDSQLGSNLLDCAIEQNFWAPWCGLDFPRQILNNVLFALNWYGPSLENSCQNHSS